MIDSDAEDEVGDAAGELVELTVRGRQIDAFDQGLRELGYIDGQNIRVESRYARGQIQQLAELAAELVKLRVDVIVALWRCPHMPIDRRRHGRGLGLPR